MDAEKEHQFWRRFHQKTITYYVHLPARPWYQRYAEHYISAHPELPRVSGVSSHIAPYRVSP